jgi:hypothetical protein
MSRAAELLQAHAEVVKLARVLGREPDQLAYLERLSPDELRQLRDGVTETLYDAHGSSLRRLAAASRLLPAGLTATIGQRAFGPLLSARLAGLLDTDKAVEVAAKLPPPFLADVAVELDPRRASELIAGISPELIGQVTAELVARHEYVAMGRFVGHLGDKAIVAALGTMDDHTLLQVAFVLEDKDELSRLLAKVPRRRSAGIIRAAAEHDLWLEALDLLNHLSGRQREDMVTAAMALDASAVDAILAAVIEHGLWAEALLIAEQDGTLGERLASQLASLPARRRRAAVQQAREAGALEGLGLLDQTPGGV